MTCPMCNKDRDFLVTRPSIADEPICEPCADKFNQPSPIPEQKPTAFHPDDIRNA